MKEMPVHSTKYPGLIALVDDADYELISQFRWSAIKGTTTFYAQTRIGKGRKDNRKLYMHRLILGLKPGDKRVGEHKNGNGLDNRRSCNLRVASSTQNHMNQKPCRGRSSKYKGVSWCKSNNKWQAQIGLGGKNNHLGFYESEGAAAFAYNQQAIKYFGEFAQLNELTFVSSELAFV